MFPRVDGVKVGKELSTKMAARPAIQDVIDALLRSSKSSPVIAEMLMRSHRFMLLAECFERRSGRSSLIVVSVCRGSVSINMS